MMFGHARSWIHSNKGILAKMATNKNFWDVLVTNNKLDIFEVDDYLLAPTSTNFHTVEAQSAQTGIFVRIRKW